MRRYHKRDNPGQQILRDQVFGRRVLTGGSGSDITLDWATISALGYWTILTNGDPAAPEVVFDSNGDVIAVGVPL